MSSGGMSSGIGHSGGFAGAGRSFGGPMTAPGFARAPSMRAPMFEGRSAFVAHPAPFARPGPAFRHHRHHRHFFPGFAAYGLAAAPYAYGYDDACVLRREWVHGVHGWRRV